MSAAKRTAILWTGGKDCNLALCEAKSAGYNVVALVTFIMGNAKFKAHPIEVMQMQAKALGLPYITIPINEPYKESYEAAIKKLKDEHGINTLITGDIEEIHGNNNWISERSRPAGVEVFLPLWHLSREILMQKIIAVGFKVVFSCVKRPWFDESWLGREISLETLVDLRRIDNLDLCGEQGEYHTLVLNGPGYKNEIVINSFIPRKDNDLMYMDITKLTLQTRETNAIR